MVEEYDIARKLGEKEFRARVSQGRYPYLPALDSIIRDVNKLPIEDVGTVEIPLDDVIGTKTEGRQNSFAANFMPIIGENSEFASKWGGVYNYQIEEGIQDPILVFEYMKKFYVQEGNKRTSVMKYLGMPTVLAHVNRILPRRTDDKENVVYYEFLDFYKVAPIYDFEFTEPGEYARLAASVGADLINPWPSDLIENVRSAYTYFCDAYRNVRIAEKEGTNPSNAFLVYLSVYDLKGLTEDAPSHIEARIEKLKKEIATTRDDSIAVLENPEEIPDPQQKERKLFGLLRRTKTYSEENPLRIAFIYNRNPENSGWIYGHELGRNHIDQVFKGVVETICFKDCATDEDLRKAVNVAAIDQNDMIITTSPVQMAETLRCAIHFPDIKFMNCSIRQSHTAVRTYYARMYEAKFLLGALAAGFAENGKIAYLADYPIFGTIANLNAFAIGAALVNPKVRIYLKWASTKEKERQEYYTQEDIRVFSGPDFILPENASRAYGVFRFDNRGNIVNLGAPVWDWGKFYELLIGAILRGNDMAGEAGRQEKAINYWWGMSSGVVDILLSDHLPYTSRKLVNSLRRGIMANIVNPFDGELRSQDGVIKGPDSGRLSNEQIITMNWLNDNIIGTIPKFEDLEDSGKAAASVSGVIKA